MSHSSKCSGGRDVLLDLFSSRVPVTCDAKTRSYQYSNLTGVGKALVVSLGFDSWSVLFINVDILADYLYYGHANYF